MHVVRYTFPTAYAQPDVAGVLTPNWQKLATKDLPSVCATASLQIRSFWVSSAMCHNDMPHYRVKAHCHCIISVCGAWLIVLGAVLGLPVLL